MSDAWIFGAPGGTTGNTARLLAELGFAPHVLPADGQARPENAPPRIPSVVIVSESVAETCRAMEGDEELRDVPLLLALDAQQLDAGTGVSGGHELLVHPFTAAELQTRVARARRAVSGAEQSDRVRCGTLDVNVATYEVSIAGRPVDFTYMEYELLKFLVTHPGRVFSREALLSRVWGYDYFGGARTVDVHVRRVRAKLGQEHAHRIRTVRSVGYRWEGA